MSRSDKRWNLANAVSLREFRLLKCSAAVFLHDPTREKAILENPQIFQNCEIKIFFPLNMPRAQAEGIQNRFTAKEATAQFLCNGLLFARRKESYDPDATPENKPL